jgi:ABC-type glycerol-3-phosphate transport system permease component
MSPAAPTLTSAWRRDWSKHIFILAFILIELFPLYMMFQVSFKDNATFIRQPWLPSNPLSWHWENWSFAFHLILPYIANTVFVAVTGTVASLFLAILGAYFFARHKLPCSGLLWAAFLALMLMPGVVNITPLFMLLKSLKLLNTLWALVLVGIAGGQQVLNIVIPMSGPIIGTLAILSFLSMWNDFLLPLIVLRDQDLFTLGVGLIYLDGEYVKQWGQIMAAYFVASIPLLVVFLFTMRLFVRGLSAGAIKG